MFIYAVTTLKILSYISWNAICYKVGSKKRIDCIKSITTYLTSLNIVYSKIFQALSSGTNFLSLEEMNYLSQYNDCAPYSPNEVYNIYDIIDELNNKSMEKDVLILKPGSTVNSGIISLVYYGRLGEKDVVIKVKRRGIREKLEDGLKLAEFLSLISKYIPYINRLNLQNVVKENRDVLLKQTDFNIELANMIEIKHKFRNVEYITIPIPYEHFTKINDNVIVMEQVKGHRINDDSFKCNTELKNKFAKIITKFVAKGLLIDKMFHSDLHSGNLFFDNSCDDKLKLGIIDFGIVNKISKHLQHSFSKLFKKIVIDKDTYGASKTVLDVVVPLQDTTKVLTAVEIQEIIDKLEPLMNIIFDLYDNGCSSLTTINDILFKYGMGLPKEFNNIYMSLVMSAGVCNELCDKNTQFLHIVREVISDMCQSFQL